MEIFYIILLASPILLIAALTLLALLVVGIRRGDRTSLRGSSGDRVDSITRRVLGVGVRNASRDEEDR